MSNLKTNRKLTGSESRQAVKNRFRQMKSGQAWIDAHPVYPEPNAAFDQLEAIIRRIPKARRRKRIVMQDCLGLRAALAALGKISR